MNPKFLIEIEDSLGKVSQKKHNQLTQYIFRQIMPSSEDTSDAGLETNLFIYVT
jgi:hypothetical protein